MELVFRICLFITGVINFLPSLFALLPEKIATSYGVEVPNANYELLLRHRAVLFGIVGGLMIYSAISKNNYDLSVLIGMVSMVSFVILYFLSKGEINAELNKVFKADLVGIGVLAIGYLLFRFKS